MIDPQRYIVFNRDDFDKHMVDYPLADVRDIEIPDAVVIRRQDVFAPVALFTYAHQVEMLIKLSGDSKPKVELDREQIRKLHELASYFSLQGHMAEEAQSNKLPDF